MTLSVIFYPYHFVRSLPFCPSSSPTTTPFPTLLPLPFSVIILLPQFISHPLPSSRDLGQVLHSQLPVAVRRVNSDTESIAVVVSASERLMLLIQYNTIQCSTCT